MRYSYSGRQGLHRIVGMPVFDGVDATTLPADAKSASADLAGTTTFRTSRHS
jgi:hypothetical protein